MIVNKALSIPLLVECEAKHAQLGEIPAVNREYHQKGIQLPTLAFELIEQGFLECFAGCRNLCSLWFDELHTSGGVDKRDLVKDSSIYKRLLRLKDYALYGEYTITPDEKDIFDVKEYNQQIKDRDIFHLPLLTDLYDDVEAVYQFWFLCEQQASRAGDDRSINFRCFALFAKTAWIRARVDFGIPGDYRPAICNDNYNAEDPIFSLDELALLTGQNPDSVRNTLIDYRNDDDRFSPAPKFCKDTKDSLSPKLRLFSEGVKGETYWEVKYYFRKGIRTLPLENFVTHSEAIIFLEENESYLESKFTS